jgi:hypothetical protein
LFGGHQCGILESDYGVVLALYFIMICRNEQMFMFISGLVGLEVKKEGKEKNG